MTSHTTQIVVDIGNTRMKWGTVSDGKIARAAGLAHGSPEAWSQRLQDWEIAGPVDWIVAHVAPRHADRFVDWARDRGDSIALLVDAAELPLEVAVAEPNAVGIDRLLNAVAANAMLRDRDRTMVIVDAGSAVTVDLIDARGVFRGGAILPGLRLAAKALNDYTAYLPLVEITETPEPLGTDTPACVRSGVYHAIVGGIESLIRKFSDAPLVCVTGGDSAIVAPTLARRFECVTCPNLTLEGIRIAVARKKRTA